MICNSFGIDDIHAFGVILWRVALMLLISGGLFVFLGVKNNPLSPLHLGFIKKY
jgi:hypothetical protein